MLDQVAQVKSDALTAIADAADEAALAAAQARYLGRKGELTALLRSMGKVEPSQRGVVGKAVNEAKNEVQAAVDQRQAELENSAIDGQLADAAFDPTVPGTPVAGGSLHPLTVVQERVERIFESMGFMVLDYPEAETEFYNFEALNIPADHPARDMQDTFWLQDGLVLRTHTSNGQVRTMREYEPPLRAVFPGRCFRYEEVDASHEHTFHQCEGLMIDRDMSVANLISVMKHLLREVFERDVKVRLRPGYFPFVEPGFELDVNCLVCDGDGCKVCKQSGWLELMPCGLVHPAVIRYGGLDPDEWTGWAFGLGLTRLAMMKYGINNIRLIMNGDLRFIEQFSGAWR